MTDVDLVAPLWRDGWTERGGSAISCIGLVHLYRSEQAQVVALRGIDLDIDAGEVVAILGPSGTGKSTLLRLLGGLLQPSAGRIRAGQHDLAAMSSRELRGYRAAEVGIVLQDAGTNLIGYGSAAENIWFAQNAARRLRSDLPPPEALLRLVGLEDVGNEPVRLLSGGAQQRVALAVAAAAAPPLLLVDEPTSQLDSSARDEVVEALLRINRERATTIVMVTHDPAVAAAVPRTVTIRDGRIGAEGRHGEEYAVVAKDGTIQLPPELFDILPPDTLVRLHPHEAGVDLRRADLGGRAVLPVGRTVARAAAPAAT